jgi:hypothetical protein
MKLEPPYKQYEGMWLSGTSNSPFYFVAKFLHSEIPKGYTMPVIEFLVVSKGDGASHLSWFPEPSEIYKFESEEKHRAVIRNVFEKKNEN